MAEKDRGKANRRQKTVRGYSETAHNSLQGRAPDEVQADQELQLALRKANS